jgi:hypothetical protein
MGRRDPQVLEAIHLALRWYRQGHFDSVVDESPEHKTPKSARPQRGETEPSSSTGETTAQIHQNRVLPLLDCSAGAIDVAGNASDIDMPISASESSLSSQSQSQSQSQTSATSSDGDSIHHFSPGYRQIPNVFRMYTAAADFDQQKGMRSHLALSQYPLSTSTSMYSGSTHSMKEMIPYPSQSTSRPLAYPHHFGNSEMPQAGTSHTIPDHFLPRQSFSLEVPQACASYSTPNYFHSNMKAGPTHFLQPHQSRHQSTVWRTVDASSLSETYPPY